MEIDAEAWPGATKNGQAMADGIKIANPAFSDWECKLFGHTSSGLTWRPNKGEEPNWFWRWMQFLVFGNRWQRVNHTGR